MVEQIRIEQIKVGQRIRQDLGNIEELAKSIKEIGLLQPIVVSEDMTLIAGQRRLEACKTLGWTEIPANILNLQDILTGEFAENAVRKDFSPSEMVAIKRALEPLEKQKAEARQHAGTPAAESDKGRVDDRVSAAIGVSRDTLNKAEVIVEAAEKEPERYEPIREKVDKKEMSINQAYLEVTSKKKKKKAASDVIFLPSEMYSTALTVISKAMEEQTEQIPIRHNKHSVVGIGEAEVVEV